MLGLRAFKFSLAFALGVSTGSVFAGAVQSHEAFVGKAAEKAQALGFDLARYQSMLDDTVTKLLDTQPGLGSDYFYWLRPSPVYPEMYSRDTFWTLFGFGQAPLFQQYVEMFSRNAQNPGWSSPLDGQIPVLLRKNVPTPDDGRRVDESTMFWVIGAKMSGKDVVSEPYLKKTYAWLKTWNTPQGLSMVSHGWIDAWEPVSTPVVSANNQGLYAVTLRALRDMGVDVAEEEIASAEAAYRNLFTDGYVHAYAGRDVVEVSSLLGEALSLYIWNDSILSDNAVRSTIAKFAQVYYQDGQFLGFKCLSNPDGSYLDLNEFWTIADRDIGNYQNGGSWLLYEALAMYAGARHSRADQDDFYVDRFVRRLMSETKGEYSSKEFICTGGTCGRCTQQTCYCPDGVCGAGSFRYGHTTYGWNVFIKNLLSAR